MLGVVDFSMGNKKMGGGALVVWMASTIAAPFAFYFLSMLIAIMDWPHDLGALMRAATIVGFVMGAIVGLVVGIGQWLALSRSVPWAGRWIGGTVIGWSIGGVAFWVFYWLPYNLFYEYDAPFNGQDDSIAYTLLSLGAYYVPPIRIGLGQFLALRHKVLGAGWWVAITVVAWGIGALVAWAGGTAVSLLFGPEDLAMHTILYGFLLAGTAGVITGLALNRLISRSRVVMASEPDAL